MIKKNDPIFLAGHNGLIGSAIYRRLIFHGYKNVITISKKNLDLKNQAKVFNFLKNYLSTDPSLANYPLWVANYFDVSNPGISPSALLGSNAVNSRIKNPA